MEGQREEDDSITKDGDIIQLHSNYNDQIETLPVKEGSQKQAYEDFRSLKIMPTRDDLFYEKPILKSINTKDVYNSVDHYLSAQFNLLQNNFFSQLHAVFKKFLSGTQENLNTVKLLGFEINGNNAGIKAQLEKPIYCESSNHFITERLLLLISNDFKSILFVSSTNHGGKELPEKYVFIKPLVDIVITPDMYKEKYLLIETNIDFDLYWKILNALKSINDTNFPMKSYLIKSKNFMKGPEYLKHQPVLNCDGLYLPTQPNEIWPNLNLDKSQLKALKNALTQEFTMIQGLPGSGKTFVTTKIIQILLENEEHWRVNGPIVIICSSNNTLNELLKTSLNYTKSIVFVENEFKNEFLKDYSLMLRHQQFSEKQNNINSLILKKKQEIKELSERIEKNCLFKKYLSAPDIIVPVACLCNCVHSMLFNSDEKFVFWLTGFWSSLTTHENIEEKKSLIDSNKTEDTADKDDTIFEETKDHPNISTNDFDEECKKTFNKESDSNFIKKDYYSYCDIYRPFNTQKNIEDYYCPAFTLSTCDQLIKNARGVIEKLKAEDINFQKSNELLVLEDSLEVMIEEKLSLQQELACHPLAKQSHASSTNPRWIKYWKWVKYTYANLINENFNLEKIYRQKKVQLDHLVQKATLQIFKEHKVIGLTAASAVKVQSSIQDLKIPIMLVEEAEKIPETHILCLLSNKCQQLILSQVGLGNIDSLYKRMYNIKDDCVFQLTWQYRMRSEIAHLLSPFTSEKINHSDFTVNYSDIKGMMSNIFFINHSYTEKSINNKNDWINIHEVNFLMEFAKYLLHQGYEPTDITILCTYSAQSTCFINKMSNDELLKQIHVSTIHTYQKKESRIVLLSLVRNNGRGRIGILKEENIMLTALSFAKEGLYLMGNKNDLTANNGFWCLIKEILKETNAIGDSLTLKCQRHVDQILKVKTAEDFINHIKNGCKKLCGLSLQCGHYCSRVCHIMHQDHIDFECKSECIEKCPNDLSCPLKCEYEKCLSNCIARLPCGHSCLEKCHSGLDSSHLEYQCYKQCMKFNADCINNHPCEKYCFEECDPCSIIIDKIHSCGHTYCNAFCSENIEKYKCKQLVNKMSSCGHNIIIECYKEATSLNCHKKCSKMLLCGHPCTESCKNPCTTECQVLVEKVESGLCNHIFSVPCYMQSYDSNELLSYCQEPCNFILKCGHVCKGTCAKCSQGRIHIPCEKPCHAVFICGHNCEVPCDNECQPCSKPCELRCQHSKCYKRCSEPCAPCQEKCEWGCKHRTCSKLCYEICDIDPCNEPCEKILQCNHPCVGFCGDPCPPLCRICDKDELTEIFFGNEDSINARYVLLSDCGHCIENEGLLKWLSNSTEYEEIIVKYCPKCTTPINICMRIMKYIKKNLMDIISIKRKIFFDDKEDIKIELTKCFEGLENLRSTVVVKESMILEQFFENYKILKKPSIKQENLSYTEINSLMTIFNTLRELITIYDFAHIRSYSNCNKTKLIDQVILILNSVPTDFHISIQRIEDLERELRRLHLMVEFFNIHTRIAFDNVFCKETNNYEVIVYELCGFIRFTEDSEKKVLNIINTENMLQERKIIVKAIGLKKGHWFKCPNGHFYIIGECGGAMERRQCIECNAIIGGGRHSLQADNALAPEIDGAIAPAWQGPLY